MRTCNRMNEDVKGNSTNELQGGETLSECLLMTVHTRATSVETAHTRMRLTPHSCQPTAHRLLPKLTKKQRLARWLAPQSKSKTSQHCRCGQA